MQHALGPSSWFWSCSRAAAAPWRLRRPRRTPAVAAPGPPHAPPASAAASAAAALLRHRRPPGTAGAWPPAARGPASISAFFFVKNKFIPEWLLQSSGNDAAWPPAAWGRGHQHHVYNTAAGRLDPAWTRYIAPPPTALPPPSPRAARPAAPPPPPAGSGSAPSPGPRLRSPEQGLPDSRFSWSGARRRLWIRTVAKPSPAQPAQGSSNTSRAPACCWGHRCNRRRVQAWMQGLLAAGPPPSAQPPPADWRGLGPRFDSAVLRHRLSTPGQPLQPPLAAAACVNSRMSPNPGPRRQRLAQLCKLRQALHVFST